MSGNAQILHAPCGESANATTRSGNRHTAAGVSRVGTRCRLARSRPGCRYVAPVSARLPWPVRSCPRAAAALALLALTQCAHASGKRPAAAAASAGPATQASAAAPAGEPPDRGYHMQATFWRALDVRDALIAGELARAKLFASTLATHDDVRAFPEDWKHWVAAMQQQADNVSLAPDLASASQAIGALALSCGDCHDQMRKGQRALPPPDPRLHDQPPDTLSERMYRHRLAADELWLGLIEPSETLWKRGTVTLTRAPLEPPVKDGEEVDARVAEDLERIRALAKAARAARSHPERARIYGQIIARCAACHLRTPR